MRFLIVVFTLALASGVSLAVTNDLALVHMLVPGFTVREFPVRLSNLNSLRFAPDGRLFALGYDGRIRVFRDTNGDGLEDTDDGRERATPQLAVTYARRTFGCIKRRTDSRPVDLPAP